MSVVFRYQFTKKKGNFWHPHTWRCPQVSAVVSDGITLATCRDYLCKLLKAFLELRFNDWQQSKLKACMVILLNYWLHLKYALFFFFTCYNKCTQFDLVTCHWHISRLYDLRCFGQLTLIYSHWKKEKLSRKQMKNWISHSAQLNPKRA